MDVSPEWLEYATKRGCSLDPLYYSQINIDLEPFRKLRNVTHPKPITSEMLELAKTHITLGSIITFENQSIHIDTDVPTHFVERDYNLFKHLSKFLPVGLTFIINHHDAPTLSRTDEHFYPIFGTCKTLLHYDIVFPSFYHYYEDCIVHETAIMSWESKMKENIIFWRGTTTGGVWNNKEQFKQSLRYQLVNWSQHIPNSSPYQADIGFTSLVQMSEDLKNEIFRSNGTLMKPSIGCVDQQNYKYLALVDGNGWLQRFIQFLTWESLLFYHPHYIEWYHPFIIPSTHYIEISDDLSDLDQKLKWAIKNEEKTKKLVKSNSRFALKHLRREDMECYYFRLLEKYSELVEIPTSHSVRSQKRTTQIIIDVSEK